MHSERQRQYLPDLPNPSNFPAEVLAEVRKIKIPSFLSQRGFAEGFSIDPQGSVDIDDVIWLEQTVINGQEENIISVSIPDLASFIPLGGEIDKEALKRGWTKYNGHGIKSSMIPEVLSCDLLSLKESQKRPAITISIAVDSNLRTERPEIKQSILINKRQLAYEDVNYFTKNGGELGATIRHLDNLLQGIIITRDIDEEGDIGVVENDFPRNVSGGLVMRAMILANKELAKLAKEENVPILFRSHLPPQNGNGPEKAYYSPVAQEHYGLNLPVYTHMTSPLRRYPDLVNQRQFIAFINGKKLPYKRSDLGGIADYLNKLIDKSRNGNGKK